MKIEILIFLSNIFGRNRKFSDFHFFSSKCVKNVENFCFQKKFKLNQGDVIILNNNFLAHGRTWFPLNFNREQRTIIRIWIK